MSAPTTSDDFLQESLESNKQAKKDAREYHKLVAGQLEVLQFSDKKSDVLVERKVDEKSNKPYSVTTFNNVIDLKSEVQEPKPLRVTSSRLLAKLNAEFSAGNFTLEILAFGEGTDRDFKVKAVKQ